MCRENKALVRSYYEHLNTTQDYRAASQLVSADFIDHADTSNRIRGIEGLAMWLRYLYRAFPDLKAEIEDIVAEGDRVVTRNLWRGTHRGSFLGIAPSGRTTEFQGILIWRIQDYKLAERWAVIDRFGLVQKLS